MMRFICFLPFFVHFCFSTIVVIRPPTAPSRGRRHGCIWTTPFTGASQQGRFRSYHYHTPSGSPPRVSGAELFAPTRHMHASWRERMPRDQMAHRHGITDSNETICANDSDSETQQGTGSPRSNHGTRREAAPGRTRIHRARGSVARKNAARRSAANGKGVCGTVSVYEWGRGLRPLRGVGEEALASKVAASKNSAAAVG